MIRILVVDDHMIFRQGLVGLLRPQEDLEVIAEAGSGMDAVRLAMDLEPDIILMDLSLPDIDGIEAARQIIEEDIDTEIILLTMYKAAEIQNLAEKIGIKGYILKNDAMVDLMYAIKAVLRGERFISSSLSTELYPTSRYPILPTTLTNREKEIVTLVAQGMTSREIADKLFLSSKTVDRHRANIMQKLELKGVADVVRYAIKTGLIQP